MKFSNNGKVILLMGSESLLQIIDAFKGDFISKYDQVINENDSIVTADFTPCS